MWSRQMKGCVAAPRLGCSTANSLRRLGASLPTAPPSTALSSTRCSFSSEEMVGEEQAWSKAMANKYGAGNYQLFRPLYKDLCDEIRREYYTKPPPPPQPARVSGRSATAVNAARASETTSSSAEEKHDGEKVSGGDQVEEASLAAGSVNSAEEENLSRTTQPSHAPPPQYGDGSWSVRHRPEINAVTFHRAAVREGRLGEVHAWSRVELKDPPRLNAVLTFADWIPMEVCVERNGVMIHFSMAANEGGMHMRNVRVYAPTSAEERAALVDPSEDGEVARKKFYYDGPCLWHLELDFQNELYDVMQDHGISLDWVHWAAAWVFYLEHVNYVRWNLGMLEELIPSPLRGPESDFLSDSERALLEEPVEDWLEAHSK